MRQILTGPWGSEGMMVARGGIEPPTRGFSVRRTATLAGSKWKNTVALFCRQWRPPFATDPMPTLNPPIASAAYNRLAGSTSYSRRNRTSSEPCLQRPAAAPSCRSHPAAGTGDGGRAPRDIARPLAASRRCRIRRCAGVTAARNLLCGANTPWTLVKCMRGGGTSAADRAIRSSGSGTMCVWCRHGTGS